MYNFRNNELGCRARIRVCKSHTDFMNKVTELAGETWVILRRTEGNRREEGSSRGDRDVVGYEGGGQAF